MAVSPTKEWFQALDNKCQAARRSGFRRELTAEVLRTML